MESIDELKRLHDMYATTVQILKTRIQFYVEEFDAVKTVIGFHENLVKELREKIEALELEKKIQEKASKDATSAPEAH